MSYDVILPWRTVRLCSHSVLKRTSPLAVVSLGAYLSHGWYDALWMQCVHVIRAAVSTPDDKVTRSVKAACKQACPLLDRKLGAAEALPCLICQQCSLPPRLITASMSDGVHNSMLDGCFDFSLCDTSVACHVVLCLSCELSATGANLLLISLFVFTNRAGVYKQASMVCAVQKVRMPYETLGTPVQLLLQAINPHNLL